MNSSSISEIKKQKSLPLYEVDTIKEIIKPIGRTIYNGEIQNGSSWNDNVICKICGKRYKRSNVTNHKKTQWHKIHDKMNDKLKKLLLE